jgi:hypothetical protein
VLGWLENPQDSSSNETIRTPVGHTLPGRATNPR